MTFGDTFDELVSAGRPLTLEFVNPFAVLSLPDNNEASILRGSSDGDGSTTCEEVIEGVWERIRNKLTGDIYYKNIITKEQFYILPEKVNRTL